MCFLVLHRRHQPIHEQHIAILLIPPRPRTETSWASRVSTHQAENVDFGTPIFFLTTGRWGDWGRDDSIRICRRWPPSRHSRSTIFPASASNSSPPAWATIPCNPLKRPFKGLILGIIGPNGPYWLKALNAQTCPPGAARILQATGAPARRLPKSTTPSVGSMPQSHQGLTTAVGIECAESNQL